MQRSECYRKQPLITRQALEEHIAKGHTMQQAADALETARTTIAWRAHVEGLSFKRVIVNHKAAQQRERRELAKLLGPHWKELKRLQKINEKIRELKEEGRMLVNIVREA